MVPEGATITLPTHNPGNGAERDDTGDEQLADHFGSIISENEQLLGTLTNPEGITRIKAGEKLAIDQPVVTVVTDERILLTTPNDDAEGGVSLGYEEIRSADSRHGATLAVTTADGVCLEWPLGERTETTGGIVAHLTWVGTIRQRLRSSRNDVDLAAGEIRASADAREWEEGEEIYRDARSELDEVCNLVIATEPIEPETLAPDLTEIERKLEEAYTRLFIERARSQLDLGRQLVENGDYVQGRKVLQRAQEFYSRAQAAGDAVWRGDDFQFGAQRDLQEDLESLGWQIETVAAEPIKQAHEAKIDAKTATDPAEKLSHWEDAFQRYGHVLTLEWGSDERNFAGDPSEVRGHIETAASRLIDLHGEVADECWNEGARLQDAGEPKAALQACIDAQEHLERAHRLADEFEPDRADEIGSRLEKMADAVMRMRNATSTAGSTSSTAESPEEPETVDEDQPASEEPPGLPTASELAEMDTHHELTLSADDLQVSTTDDESDPLERERSEDPVEESENEPEVERTNGGTPEQ